MKINLKILSLLILCFIAFINNSCSNNDSDVDIENNVVEEPVGDEESEEEEEEDSVIDTTGKYTNMNGLVILESENTSSDLDLWVVKMDVPDYTGTGHLEFTGNTQASGPAMSPLKYRFTMTETAVYRLVIKSRKRLAGEASDRSNDSYVRMEGDFDQSPTAANEHLKPATKEHLIKNRKVFGGKANEWGWSDRMDLGHNNKRFVEYLFKAGETYTFTVSGRSKNYNIDKIIFFKTSQYKPGEAREAAFLAEETIGQ